MCRAAGVNRLRAPNSKQAFEECVEREVQRHLNERRLWHYKFTWLFGLILPAILFVLPKIAKMYIGIPFDMMEHALYALCYAVGSLTFYFGYRLDGKREAGV